MKRREFLLASASSLVLAREAIAQTLMGIPGCGPGVPTTNLGSFGVPNGCAPGVPNSLGGGPSIPALANLVAHFDASTVSGTNGQTVTSWTDSVNSIVAGTTIGTGPTLVTNALNSLNSVKFAGGGGLSIATPGALKTAIDSQLYTVMIAARSNAVWTSTALFSATAGGDSFFYELDGASAGRFSSALTPYTPLNTFTTLGSSGSNLYSGIASNTCVERPYVNGTSVQPIVKAAIVGTGGNTICIGTNAGNNFPCKAEIFDIFVWNVELTPLQQLQWEMYIRTKYAQAYPWAGVSSMVVFDGDSITAGVLGTYPTGSYPWQCAANLGLTLGQWQNYGIGGITIANNAVLAPNGVDGIPALIGKKVKLSVFEWYNQRGVSPTPYNNSAAYLAGRKAASSQIEICFGTSTDNTTSGDETNRAAYNSAWDASHALNIDSYVAIHNNANIGVSGAASNATYFGDGVHLTNTGYGVLAGLMQTGIQALP